MLIDTEIGKMNESFGDTGWFSGVGVGGEASEPFVEHVYPEGIVAGDENIDPKIILEGVNCMRIGNILRNKDIFLAF